MLCLYLLMTGGAEILQDRAEITRLLTSLRDGDRSAFEPFVGLVQPIVKRFAAKLLGDSAELDDVIQEVLMKVFTRIMDYDPSREALPWVLAITRYECLTVRKKIVRRKESYLDAGIEVIEVSDVQQISAEDASATADAINDILGQLSEVDRRTIIIRMQEETDASISPATLRKRWQRARRRFMSLWKEKYEE